ncbi:MAG: hypothetical protein AB7L13_17025 [Acidimicrobiia bacterium]
MNCAVLATCKQCGDVELDATEVTWWAEHATGHLMFRCPTCRALHLIDVSHRAIDALRQVDAPRWTPESVEPRPDNPPMSTAEVDDLLDTLRDIDNWIDALDPDDQQEPDG